MNSCQYDFSIVIPTFNRPDELPACLHGIAKSDYPRDRFEVIVVDDGGRTPLDRLITSFSDVLHIRLLSQTNSGPSAARNAGVRAARGKFVVFIDDDCVPADDWLSVLMERLRENPNRMVGGKTLNALTDNKYSEMSQRILDMAYSFYNANPDQAIFFASNNMAMPVESFRQIGGFRLDFRTAEDRELCDNWKHHGFPIIYEPRARMYHFHHLTLSSFLKQHFFYGRGAFRFNRSYAHRHSASNLNFSFYVWMIKQITHIVSNMPLNPKITLISMFLMWKTADTAGFFMEFANQLFRKKIIKERP